MSGAARAFEEWWDNRYPGYDPDWSEFDKGDLTEAFIEGWSAAMGAEWTSSSVPMLDIQGGQRLGPR